MKEHTGGRHNPKQKRLHIFATTKCAGIRVCADVS